MSEVVFLQTANFERMLKFSNEENVQQYSWDFNGDFCKIFKSVGISEVIRCSRPCHIKRVVK